MNTRKINLNLEAAGAKIIYHYFKNVKVKTFLISFISKRRILSTLEGFREVKFVGNHYNPPRLWNFVHKNKKGYEEKICSQLGIDFKDIAMLYTGADMDNIFIKMEKYQDIKVYACVTAGVKSNAQRMGVDKAKSVEKVGIFKNLSTVNIIVLTNASLTDGAMARGIITITEAKTLAFQDLNIRSSYNPKFQATGTGTDNVIIVSGFGPKITYVGGHTKAGEIIAKAATSAVKGAILKQDGISLSRSIEKRLKERGITLDDLIETGLEMYIARPRKEDRKKVKLLLKKELAKTLNDVNVASFILAGLRLEEEGERGAIPSLGEKEYKKDPVHLIADEMLGIQIATYIGGSRALFEFERFDRKKPGILKKLPPFLDDIIGGLISGALVKVCSRS